MWPVQSKSYPNTVYRVNTWQIESVGRELNTMKALTAGQPAGKH